MHTKLWLTILSFHSMAALAGPEVWGSFPAPVFALAGSYGGSFGRPLATAKQGGTFSPHGEYNG